MKLVDIAQHILTEEPAEDRSIVRRLGNTIAWWPTREGYVINLLEEDEQTTRVLSIDFSHAGLVLSGFNTLIDSE